MENDSQEQIPLLQQTNRITSMPEYNKEKIIVSLTNWRTLYSQKQIDKIEQDVENPTYFITDNSEEKVYSTQSDGEIPTLLTIK